MPEKCSFLSYGKLWNIDHYIPCHAVGQWTEETFKTICSYDNLIPKTIEDNSSKCASIYHHIHMVQIDLSQSISFYYHGFSILSWFAQ